MKQDFTVDHQHLDGMTYQLCGSRAATHRIAPRSPAAPRDFWYYCAQCYEAKYLRCPGPGKGLPRPRFAIKHLMVLVAIFSVPNAIAALVMNSGLFSGTPAQLREWTIFAFLAANLLPAFHIAVIALLAWTDRVWIDNWTGGVLIPQVELTPRQRRAMFLWLLLCVAWFAIAHILPVWLVKLWPSQLAGTYLVFLILPAPLPVIVFLSLATNRAMRNRVRQQWKIAGLQERVLRLTALAWLIGTLLALGLADLDRAFWGLRIWFPIPPVLLVWFGVTVSLNAAMAISTRPR
jgi:hypothetical protein